MKMRLHVAAMLLPALFSALPASATAQTPFPNRPLTIVVPYPAGGVADQITRPIAQALGEKLGQPVVVENRPGANGNIGSTLVARQQPADGHTLLLGSLSTLAINPHLYPSMGYNPLTDLQPVTLTHQMPNVLIAGTGTPYRTVADLITDAKARPGEISYGSAGNGNTMHLTGVQFEMGSGTQLMHVPYSGAPPALNDVLAGQIPTMFINLPAVVNFEKAGRVRVLGVASNARSPVLSHVPTLAESGVSGVDSNVWNGLLVRSGTPPAAVEKLNAALREVLADPKLRAPLEAVGYEILSSTPEEMANVVRNSHAAMGETIAKAKIRID
jgi:tripartite-type tricarboxylate transporter receptor subunit TctC